MNLDIRPRPKIPPMFGCNSELDKYRPGEEFACGLETRETERACEGCKRREVEEVGAGETATKSLRDMTEADFDATHNA